MLISLQEKFIFLLASSTALVIFIYLFILFLTPYSEQKYQTLGVPVRKIQSQQFVNINS